MKLPGLPMFRRSSASAPAPSQPAEDNRELPPDGDGRVKTKWLDMPYSEVAHDGEVMRFATTGSSSKKRIRTLFSKEPVTLAWIDTFQPEDTLYDVGANLGMYSIYAAVMRRSKVFAFEPEALNYAELNKNIYLNELHDRVLAYCLALSNVDKVDRLLLSDFGVGISYHDFEENSWTEDKQFAPDWNVSREGRRPQGAIGFRLDALAGSALPVPDHIKIDVDGLEHRVVDGMIETLRRPELKTVLVEINFDNPKNLEAIDRITELGWRYSWDQLRINRKTKFTVDQIRRYQERGVGGLNYIFYKDPFYEAFFSKLFEAYVPGEPLDAAAVMKSVRAES